MIINIDRENVTIIDYENANAGRIEELITRDEFTTRFGIDISSVQTLAYETDRNIYHLEKEGVVHSFNDPTESRILELIHTAASSILDSIEDGVIAEAKPSEYHTLNGKVWEISADNQLLLDRDASLLDINRAYEEQIAGLTAGIPASETKTWTKQETEARAYLVDNQVTTPLIDAIATARGVQKADLVTKIISKADAFAVVVGEYTGARQKAEDLLGV